MSLSSSMADFVPCDRLLQKAYSRDFVDKHYYSIICYLTISADYTVRSSHLWLKSTSTSLNGFE